MPSSLIALIILGDRKNYEVRVYIVAEKNPEQRGFTVSHNRSKIRNAKALLYFKLFNTKIKKTLT